MNASAKMLGLCLSGDLAVLSQLVSSFGGSIIMHSNCHLSTVWMDMTHQPD